jgi:hypothetical protein
MALLGFNSGGAYYDTAHGAKVWTVFNDSIVDPTGGRGGTTPGLAPSASGLLSYAQPRVVMAVSPSPGNEIYVGFLIKQAVGPTGGGTYVWASLHGPQPFSTADTGGRQVTLITDGGGHASLVRGSWTGTSILGPTSGGVLAGAGEKYVELYAKIHDTNGALELRVDNTTVLYGTGLNTRGLSVTSIGGFELIPGTATFSHIYWLDPSTGERVYFLGKGAHAEALFANAAGDFSQMTPLSGSNYQNVDDTAPDDGATNVNAPAVNLVDTYGMTDLSNDYDVLGVELHVYAKKTASALLRQLEIGARIDGANYAHSTQTLSDVLYQYLNGVWELAPDDNTAWTRAKINAMQAYLKRVA